ncbi:hypothetical protein DPEC_G00223830 [Dallia pectoralis]|uniref:Uncharacterized protein n=1 Tax=Dallia pectoralis TaxID=75939 RepID=A0ACC2FZW4_DALPE|nr:hypothetical protein DPEC_G00223830 [Dallia pectoralis]
MYYWLDPADSLPTLPHFSRHYITLNNSLLTRALTGHHQLEQRGRGEFCYGKGVEMTETEGHGQCILFLGDQKRPEILALQTFVFNISMATLRCSTSPQRDWE